jgi:hypothetical protein
MTDRNDESEKTMTSQNSRAWFPGTYVPAAQVTGFEVLTPRHTRVEAQVSKGTVFHGTSGQMVSAGLAMIRAALEADPAIGRLAIRAMAKLTQ